MTNTEAKVEQRHRDYAIELLNRMPDTGAYEYVADFLARFEAEQIAKAGEEPWHSPLGGLIEARRVMQQAYKYIEQAKAENTHIPGNPYDMALAALNPALAELAVLVQPALRASPPSGEKDMGHDVADRLRDIIVRHTFANVGIDTAGIARAAHALGTFTPTPKPEPDTAIAVRMDREDFRRAVEDAWTDRATDTAERLITALRPDARSEVA
jgi:hypothetical protein